MSLSGVIYHSKAYVKSNGFVVAVKTIVSIIIKTSLKIIFKLWKIASQYTFTLSILKAIFSAPFGGVNTLIIINNKTKNHNTLNDLNTSIILTLAISNIEIINVATAPPTTNVIVYVL